ncbi:MAG: hypothetical protein JKX97_00415, partial [Candidatus Lindowbacteria bacterium]|nr:hypothetical protein [Candidatus Lindowbacteria bacterium]
TTSSGSVITDEGNGTLFFVITTSSTPPTKAQVKLGQDDSGSAATDSGNQAVTVSGVQNITGSGLTNNTAYTTHYMHEDAPTNQSGVSTASGFTTAASGALNVANQAIDFGDKTANGSGLYTLEVIAGTVTSAAITSGDASGHWTIATNGDLTPSAAGDTANLSLGPYSLACSYNSGADTATHTVTIESGASCISHTEAETHVTATSTSADDFVLLRGGQTIGSRGVVFDYDKGFDGTISDPDRNDKTEGAKATYSGGSITFRRHANDASAPVVDGVFRMTGAGPFYLDKLDFINAPTSDSSYNDQSAAGDNLNKQLHVQSGASVIANECNFGCQFYEPDNDARWGHAVYSLVSDALIVQGCNFDGFWHGVTCRHANPYIVRDCDFANQIHDTMRAMTNEGGTGDVELWWQYNVARKAIKRDRWISDDFDTSNNALHVDFMQISANSDTNNYIVHINHNRSYLIGYRSQSYFRGGNQGINVTGEITNNFFANTNTHGISNGNGEPMVVANNSVISSINDSSQKFPSASHKIRSTRTDVIAIDNLMGALVASGTGSFTPTGNVTADHMDNTGGVEDYAALFDGPFDSFNEDFGKQFTVDESSRANFVSSIDSLFTPKAGGEAVGKGFLTEFVADVVAPILSLPTDTANGGTASTGTVTTDEDNGTLYWVVTESSTPPTAAQVKLGQDNSSVAATDSDNQTVIATGIQNIAADGLTETTAYTTHYMHEDAATNPSSVSTASGFTTTSGFTAFAVDSNTASDQFNSFRDVGSAIGANDAQFTIALHYRPGTNAANKRIFQLRDSGFAQMVDLRETGTGRLQLTLKNSSSTTVVSKQTAASTFVDGTWYAIQISGDLSSGSPVFHWFVDDSQVTFTGTETLTGSTDVGWAVAEKMGLMCESNGGGDFDGSLANLYINSAEFVDISVAGNRLKFSNTDTTQVDMGSDGSTPTGTSPLFFFDGALAGWSTNKGTGPSGTDDGTLISASSLPGV